MAGSKMTFYAVKLILRLRRNPISVMIDYTSSYRMEFHSSEEDQYNMIKVKEIYDILLAHYGKPPWWSKNPFEVMVGAVLVQNTAWSNVQKVVADFGDNLTPDFVANVTPGELEDLIRPCGFYLGKAACLKRVTKWYQGYGGCQQRVMAGTLEQIREELLAIKGIGKETADVICLYAFYFPTFVIDAYTKRLAERLELPVTLQYEAMKQFFETSLETDTDLFGSYHWLILTHAIRHCKKKPQCGGCPLAAECHYQQN